MNNNTLTFEEIKNIIGNYKNLWVIGERKWSYILNQEILECDDNNTIPKKTGIFLHKEIKDHNTYQDCRILIYFNEDTQLHFIQQDDSCEYIYYECIIQPKQDNILKLKNLKKSDKDYRFASKLHILENLGTSDIKVVEDKDKNIWRLYHE